MSVWLRHRCLRSPQRSLDARRPSWWGGSTLCERQRAWSVSAPLPRPQARGPTPPPRSRSSSPSPHPYLLFFCLTISFLLSLYLSLSHHIFPYHTLSFSYLTISHVYLTTLLSFLLFFIFLFFFTFLQTSHLPYFSPFSSLLFPFPFFCLYTSRAFSRLSDGLSENLSDHWEQRSSRERRSGEVRTAQILPQKPCALRSSKVVTQ